MIVVFTIQSKKCKCEQIQLVMKELDIPFFVVIVTDKSESYITECTLSGY